ncbi:phosphodiester glycosidase family protein [Paenibacillus aurantiacus]|uniref:Phosphodiester glycosidase family protein n=1 Tax=Paenibacillus aurantiacus TaxID=1936118 RepID=A0ABV5KK55_9BACL
MNQSNRKPKRKLAIGLTVSVLAVGGIIYGLADRYLIEHVEVVVAQPTVAAASSTVTANTGASAATTSATIDAEPSAVADSSAATAAASDDWNYTSDAMSIAIQKVETGTGADKITYYATDVQLKSAANLLTAFADNAFGRNIIANTSDIASSNNAIFAINGDYYGFRDNGVIIRNGNLYRNEPARTGLAMYSDGTMASYNEEEISAEELLAQGVTNTFSFGPVLVKDGSVATDLDDVRIDNNFGNRSIDGANPRTGVGIIAPNHYVFVVVDGRQANYSRGMTLNEFAQLFEDLGATEAYNLDGGGSSTMYFNGSVVNSPGSKGQERGVSDIIYLAE